MQAMGCTKDMAHRYGGTEGCYELLILAEGDPLGELGFRTLYENFLQPANGAPSGSHAP